MNTSEAHLCELCQGTTEGNTRFDRDNVDSPSGDKNVYRHKINLTALQGSALDGCTLCTCILELLETDKDNATTYTHGVVSIFHRSLYLLHKQSQTTITGPVQTLRSRSSKIANSETSSIKGFPYEEEDLMSCIPIGYMISGFREGAAQIVTTCHYPPPKDTEPGTLFISRDSNVPFRKIDVVISRRTFEYPLKNIVNCGIEVFTTAGLSPFN